MRERDLQDYLFANPQVLFPGQDIEERHREFVIEGKRIDLLFKVDGVRFIVELKAVPLQREHVGQVAEYYGRMKILNQQQCLRMILVAPSIPDYRRVYLEELGIRCVEIPSVPASDNETARLQKTVSTIQKTEDAERKINSVLPEDAHLTFSEVALPVSRESLALSHRILRDSLGAIGKGFQGYELRPVKMARADSPDYYCGMTPVSTSEKVEIAAGGTWWAYRFGHAEEMPKNDVPNISVLMMPWGLDVTVNAEISDSQEVLISRVKQSIGSFDKLVDAHGELWLQTWLKLEHRPQFFHWISRTRLAPGAWGGADLVRHFDESREAYPRERAAWIDWVTTHRPDLSDKQRTFLKNRSQNMNLAIRLVAPFHEEAQFWSCTYAEQVRLIEESVCRLRPFIDFFIH